MSASLPPEVPILSGGINPYSLCEQQYDNTLLACASMSYFALKCTFRQGHVKKKHQRYYNSTCGWFHGVVSPSLPTVRLLYGGGASAPTCAVPSGGSSSLDNCRWKQIKTIMAAKDKEASWFPSGLQQESFKSIQLCVATVFYITAWPQVTFHVFSTSSTTKSTEKIVNMKHTTRTHGCTWF